MGRYFQAFSGRLLQLGSVTDTGKTWCVGRISDRFDAQAGGGLLSRLHSNATFHQFLSPLATQRLDGLSSDCVQIQSHPTILERQQAWHELWDSNSD